MSAVIETDQELKEEALEKGMEEKSKEFTEGGSELYQKSISPIGPIRPMAA